jgi:hypothetical protein
MQTNTIDTNLVIGSVSIKPVKSCNYITSGQPLNILPYEVLAIVLTRASVHGTCLSFPAVSVGDLSLAPAKISLCLSVLTGWGLVKKRPRPATRATANDRHPQEEPLPSVKV